MSDIAGTVDGDGESEDDPATTAVVPTVGVVLSAVVLAALLFPVRRGVDEPAVWLGVAGALAAAVAFVGRRHGLLERAVAGAVAAGGQVAVVLLSGYAITQGTLGSVSVSGIGQSVSLLFVAFFTAMAAAGVGVADRAGISGRGLLARFVQTIEMGALALIGLYSLAVATLLLSVPLVAVVGEPTELQMRLIEYPAYAIGLGSVVAGYFLYRDRDRSFIDLERPTLRTVGWIVVGLVLIFAANIAISQLMGVLGIEASEHTATEQIAENPEQALVAIPGMILFVGPFEELLYRNVVQKSLYERFSRPGAVVVGGLVFMLVHVTAYATAGPGSMLASLSLVFALGLILGALYERTENLLVPALVHGCYNALIFVQFLF